MGEVEPSSGGFGGAGASDGSEEMMVKMMIDDVELISGIHIASRIRKVLRPVTSTQVFLGFPVSTSES